MKKILFLILVLSFSVFAQNPTETKAERKERIRQEKAQKKERIRQEKAQLTLPVEITINAPAETIAGFLIRGIEAWDFQVDENSPKKLLFSKNTRGKPNKILAGLAIISTKKVHFIVQVDFSEVSGSTSVTVSGSLTEEKNFANRDSAKEFRRELDALLTNIKRQAEAKQQKKETG